MSLPPTIHVFRDALNMARAMLEEAAYYRRLADEATKPRIAKSWRLAMLRSQQAAAWYRAQAVRHAYWLRTLRHG